MLSAAERAWVDAYHAKTLAIVGPQLDDADARAWLEAACAPL
jgi:Xaa-Pro aminopeptidase